MTMKSINLLSKYPLSTRVIKDWYIEEMIKSLKNNDVPEDFKQSILKESVSNERLAEVINIQPRNLFGVFDDNDIVIETSLYPNGEFTIKIGNEATTNSWKTRKEAELFAVEAAFEILENKLTLIDLPKLEE